jgi:hypothetical protein
MEISWFKEEQMILVLKVKQQLILQSYAAKVEPHADF